MPWNHGTSTIDRTCGAETPVDTADVTVWSYHVGADTDGDVTENRVPGTPEQMILSVTTNDVYRNVLRTANLAVTQQRLRTVLTFPLQNARAKISIAGGQGVVDHRVYYEIVMYQSANPPPTLPGRNNSFNVACVVQGFNPLCTSVANYTHSFACLPLPSPPPPMPPSPPPSPPSPLPPPPPTCGHDCSCECCMPSDCPTRSFYSFRGGSAASCTDYLCSANNYGCPDPGLHNSAGFVSATYTATPPCGGWPPPSPIPHTPPSVTPTPASFNVLLVVLPVVGAALAFLVLVLLHKCMKTRRQNLRIAAEREASRRREEMIKKAIQSKIASLQKKIWDGESHGECAICMTEYKKGEELLVLPCKHAFKTHCINEWLMNKPKKATSATTSVVQIPTCPLCKAPLIVEPPEDGVTHIGVTGTGFQMQGPTFTA